jgi:beta-phosphoglucomutase
MHNQQNDTPNLTKAILWDLDGTLIDTSQYHWQAWTAELAALGRSITHTQFTACFGQRNDTVLRLWIDPDISSDDIHRISASKEERYRHMILAGGLQLLPGAESCLKMLHQAGWRQALATMTNRENIEAIFTVVRIEKYFDAVVTGDEVAHGKPEPDIFLQAANRVHVATERCIVIEDAPAGIEAARRAGMKSIGVNQKIKLAADWSVSSLELLPPDIFHRLLNGKGG